MDDYINKVKYLKERVKISLKDVNGQNEKPFDNREACIQKFKGIDKEELLQELIECGLEVNNNE